MLQEIHLSGGRGGGGGDFFWNNPLERSVKKIRAPAGSETVTSVITCAMLHELSYEATHWEQGQLIDFISSREE